MPATHQLAPSPNNEETNSSNNHNWNEIPPPQRRHQQSPKPPNHTLILGSAPSPCSRQVCLTKLFFGKEQRFAHSYTLVTEPLISFAGAHRRVLQKTTASAAYETPRRRTLHSCRTVVVTADKVITLTHFEAGNLKSSGLHCRTALLASS